MTLTPSESSRDARAQMLAVNLTFVRAYAADVAASFTRAVGLDLPSNAAGIISAREAVIERAAALESAYADLSDALTYASDPAIIVAINERMHWLNALLTTANTYIEACRVALDTAHANEALTNFDVVNDICAPFIIAFIPNDNGRSEKGLRFSDMVYTMHPDSRTVRWESHFTPRPYFTKFAKTGTNEPNPRIINMRDENEFALVSASIAFLAAVFVGIDFTMVAALFTIFIVMFTVFGFFKINLTKARNRINDAPQVSLYFIEDILREYKRGRDSSLAAIFHRSEYLNRVRGPIDTERIDVDDYKANKAHYEHEQRATTEWLDETIELLCAVYMDASKPTTSTPHYGIPEKYEEALYTAVERYAEMVADPEHEQKMLEAQLKTKELAASKRDEREEIVNNYLQRQNVGARAKTHKK